MPCCTFCRAAFGRIASVARRCAAAIASVGLVVFYQPAKGAPLAEAPLRSDQPLTIVVTFPPGGGTDWLARTLGAALQERLGLPVVVENRPGASGNIGARTVARAQPDGHTLLMVNSSFAINPGVFERLDFDPAQDFAAVMNVASVPSVILVPSQSPFGNLDDALATASAQRPLQFASCGNGTPQHLAAEMLAQARSVAMQQIPYKGCGPALAAVVGNQVPMALVTASSAAKVMESGMVRALAVTSQRRSAHMPDIPTVAEQGVPGYAVEQWHGLLAPAGTPQATIAYLNQELRTVLAQSEMQSALKARGYTLDISSAEDFQRLLHSDIRRYGRVTQSLKLKMD